MISKQSIQAALCLSSLFPIGTIVATFLYRTHCAGNEIFWDLIPLLILAAFVAFSLFLFLPQKDVQNKKNVKAIRYLLGFLCLILGIALHVFLVTYFSDNNNIALKILFLLSTFVFCVFFSIYVLKYGKLNKYIERYGYAALHLRNVEALAIWPAAMISIEFLITHINIPFADELLCLLIFLAGILLFMMMLKKKKIDAGNEK